MTKEPMTPYEFWEKMWRIKTDPDLYKETAHIAMDEVMCDLLRELGYGDGVKLFEEMPKWYS